MIIFGPGKMKVLKEPQTYEFTLLSLLWKKTFRIEVAGIVEWSFAHGEFLHTDPEILRNKIRLMEAMEKHMNQEEEPNHDSPNKTTIDDFDLYDHIKD